MSDKTLDLAAIKAKHKTAVAIVYDNYARIGYAKAQTVIETLDSIPALIAEVERMETRVVDLESSRDYYLTENERLSDADRWIPVTERLPEHGSVVLTYSVGGQMHQNCFKGDEHQPVWNYITHWRPLPAAPERPVDANKTMEDA